MAIRNLEEFKVGEDYMSNLAYIKEFEVLSKTYKMGCDFEHIEGINFKVVKETPTIYCYNHRVAIYPKNDTISEAHIMTSVNFEKKFKEKGVRMIEHEEEMLDGKIKKCYQWGADGEFVLQFYTEDMDKVADIFKIRKANKGATNPHSLRNLHDYLRFARNIDSSYNDILDQRILANRDESSED